MQWAGGGPGAAGGRRSGMPRAGDYAALPGLWHNVTATPWLRGPLSLADPGPAPSGLAGPHPAGRRSYRDCWEKTTPVAVKIKLKRLGKVHAPYYRVVVADARSKRDGRAIEEIGKYHPKQEPSLIEIDSERAQYWLSVGAQPTDPVRNLLKITGDWQRFRGEEGAEGTLKSAPARPDKRNAFAAALKETHGETETAATTAKTRGRRADAKTDRPDARSAKGGRTARADVGPGKGPAAQQAEAVGDKADTVEAGTDKARADKAGTDKAGTDKARTGKARADKAGADRSGAGKTGADKTGADKAGADKARGAKATADKATADKASTDKASADKADAEKTAASRQRKPATRRGRAGDHAEQGADTSAQASAAKASDRAGSDRAGEGSTASKAEQSGKGSASGSGASGTSGASAGAGDATVTDDASSGA